MKNIIVIILLFSNVHVIAQTMKIFTQDETELGVQLIAKEQLTELVTKYSGFVDSSLWKEGTSRTYRLSNNQLLLEFYDQQGVVIKNIDEFNLLSTVHFVKNTIDFLKKNVSYKVELTESDVLELIEKRIPKKNEKFKSDLPEWYDFEVYELSNGQLLFWDKTQNNNGSALYPDIKTLVSQANRPEITYLEYGSDDDEYMMKRIAMGDALPDYEFNSHLMYPKYETAIIKNHKLKLIEDNVHLDNFFYSNLFKSESGYYITLSDFNQSGINSTDKIKIGTLRIYQSIEDVRSDQQRLMEIKNRVKKSEHFFQVLNDAYSKDFIEKIPSLIDKLSDELNIDSEHLSFDSAGIETVDQALKWNIKDWRNDAEWFDRWFPLVLAFYGQCYIHEKNNGQWVMTYDQESDLWIPEVQLADGTMAWESGYFYKSMFEGPLPLKWAGDWDGSMKKRKQKRKNGR